MAVKMVLAIREGWKQKDNERFGDCLEVRFINTENNMIMFRYAPKLEDKPFWTDMWHKLEAYDTKHKELYGLVKLIDPTYTVRGIEVCEPKK